MIIFNPNIGLIGADTHDDNDWLSSLFFTFLMKFYFLIHCSFTNKFSSININLTPLNNSMESIKIKESYLDVGWKQGLINLYILLSGCVLVGFVYPPRSHSYLCFRGGIYLLPRCNSKSIGYI
ncbi:hypothetical protein A9255_01575 [Xenorhabdus hominickii]|uniref:Uncharacterized protein n=1 Tax=Xenorhabdus hominickii TaxID=351679 RepID=A0A2G0Q6I6_XENHO|nr:hypothetical protein A9255_01575 [Xenorhabdus hominickii]PHM54837.1 hypothetical protein Xhom_02794 [Xenorhabdus hominickii]